MYSAERHSAAFIGDAHGFEPVFSHYIDFSIKDEFYLNFIFFLINYATRFETLTLSTTSNIIFTALFTSLNTETINLGCCLIDFIQALR